MNNNKVNWINIKFLIKHPELALNQKILVLTGTMNKIQPKNWKSQIRKRLWRKYKTVINLVIWMNLCLLLVLYPRKSLYHLLVNIEKLEIPIWAELMNSSKFLRENGYSLRINSQIKNKILTFSIVKLQWPKLVAVTQNNQLVSHSKHHLLNRKISSFRNQC
jgi:hypothetical protein